MKVSGLFDTLDHANLDPELRLRYLLQHVFESVRLDGAVFQRFLIVLDGCNKPVKELAKHLRRRLSGGAGTREADSIRAVGGVVFLKDDVSPLFQILLEASDKWKQIGIVLGIPDYILDDCSKDERKNELKLHNLLCGWLKGDYPNAKPASLNDLKQTLASEFVGRTDLALALEKKYFKAKTTMPKTGAGMTPDVATSLTITYQSRTATPCVAEGKSILYEIQVSPSVGVCYQWMREGQSLNDDVIYSGTHSAMLTIWQARQGTEGKYTCHIRKDEEKIISREFNLTVTFPPEKKHLIDTYSKAAEIPEASWPPKVSKTFINLALITNKQAVSDDTDSAQGDEYDIVETKTSIEFDEVFGRYERGALVLVEGRPGTGKTTLVHKVTRDWAKGGEALKGAQLVFLIPLRHLISRKSVSLSDILKLVYPDTLCEDVVRQIEESSGEGVCFIFDGLDELPPQDETSSVIHKLLHGNLLPAAMLIVTSRPVATKHLRCKPKLTKRIEVLGFNSEQIFKYINSFPFTLHSTSLRTQLSEHLKSNENLLHMCQIPVCLAIICYLYECERVLTPPTKTEIYVHFATSIVLRHQRRTDTDAQLSSLQNLHGEDKNFFNNICCLAFDMTIKSIQTICHGDINVQLSPGTSPDDAPSLGLVTIDSVLKRQGSDKTYSFLHLTLQEYLAAFHLANQGKKQQKKMIKSCAGQQHLRMFWRFYFGIAKFENKVDQIEFIIRSVGTRSEESNLFGVQCAFESQQAVVCNFIVAKSSGVLCYNGCTITLADMSSLGYVISSSSNPVTELSMNGCYLKDDHVRILLQEIGHGKLNHIKTLRFRCNCIGGDGAAALTRLDSCTNLETLELTDNKIDGDGVVNLVAGLKSCNSLQTLLLHNNNIGANGAAALAKGAKFCTNLNKLGLNSTNICDAGAAALADGLKYYNNLETLVLSDNNVTAVGAAALVHGLESCDNLRNLKLANNKISDDGAISLAKGLKSCKNLQILALSNNNIGDLGATALGDGLKRCPNLQTLWIHNNHLGGNGRKALKDRLLKCHLHL